jgi:hypothetical protein
MLLWAFLVNWRSFIAFAGNDLATESRLWSVVEIGLFSAGIFYWLAPGACFSWRAALLAALISTLNFQIAALTRSPDEIHAKVLYPWILGFITQLMRSRTSAAIAMSATRLFLASWILLSLDKTRIAEYALLVLPLYSFFLYFHYSFEELSVEGRRRNLALTGAAGAAACAFAVLCPLGCLPDGQSEERAFVLFPSISHSLQELAGSLVFPPILRVESWIFFGMPAAALAIFYLLSSGSGEERDNRQWWQRRRVRLALVLWLLLLAALSQRLTEWNCPFSSGCFGLALSLGQLGGAQWHMVMAIAFMLCCGMMELELRVARTFSDSRAAVLLLRQFTYPLILLFTIQLFLMSQPYSEYWLAHRSHFAGTEHDFLLQGVFATGFYYLVILSALFAQSVRPLAFLPFIFAVISAWEVSPWIARIASGI